MKSPTGYPEFKIIKKALMYHLHYAGENGSYVQKAYVVLADFFCLSEKQRIDKDDNGLNIWEHLLRSVRDNLNVKYDAIYGKQEKEYVYGKWILKPGAMERYLQSKVNI